jgi:phage-related protein
MDWIGTSTALIGAYLLSFNAHWSRFGWIAYFISNIVWIIYGVHAEIWSLVAMQVGFMGATMNGIYRTFGQGCDKI